MTTDQINWMSYDINPNEPFFTHLDYERFGSPISLKQLWADKLTEAAGPEEQEVPEEQDVQNAQSHRFSQRSTRGQSSMSNPRLSQHDRNADGSVMPCVSSDQRFQTPNNQEKNPAFSTQRAVEPHQQPAQKYQQPSNVKGAQIQSWVKGALAPNASPVAQPSLNSSTKRALPNKDMKGHMWQEQPAPQHAQGKQSAHSKRIPYPRRSWLTKEEQKIYLDLCRKYTDGVGDGQSVSEHPKEIALLKDLQLKVAAEQEEFLAFLEQAARQSGDDYHYLHPAAKHYVQEYLRYQRQRVFLYPQYYVQSDSVPLTAPRNGPWKDFIHHKVLLQMGRIPRVSRHKIEFNSRLYLPQDYERVNSRHPAEPKEPEDPKAWHKAPCSRDENAEKLATQYGVDIVISSTGLKCILDNHSPNFEFQWEIPVVVKEHNISERGSSKTVKVVYVDKPLPAKSMTARDKNLYYHKFALRTQLQHPVHTNTIWFGGKSKCKEKVSTATKQKKKPSTEDEGLFVGVSTDLDDLETFGTNFAGKSSAFKKWTPTNKEVCDRDVAKSAGNTQVLHKATLPSSSRPVGPSSKQAEPVKQEPLPNRSVTNDAWEPDTALPVDVAPACKQEVIHLQKGHTSKLNQNRNKKANRPDQQVTWTGEMSEPGTDDCDDNLVIDIGGDSRKSPRQRGFSRPKEPLKKQLVQMPCGKHGIPNVSECSTEDSEEDSRLVIDSGPEGKPEPCPSRRSPRGRTSSILNPPDTSVEPRQTRSRTGSSEMFSSPTTRSSRSLSSDETGGSPGAGILTRSTCRLSSDETGGSPVTGILTRSKKRRGQATDAGISTDEEPPSNRKWSDTGPLTVMPDVSLKKKRGRPRKHSRLEESSQDETKSSTAGEMESGVETAVGKVRKTPKSEQYVKKELIEEELPELMDVTVPGTCPERFTESPLSPSMEDPRSPTSQELKIPMNNMKVIPLERTGEEQVKETSVVDGRELGGRGTSPSTTTTNKDLSVEETNKDQGQPLAERSYLEQLMHEQHKMLAPSHQDAQQTKDQLPVDLLPCEKQALLPQSAEDASDYSEPAEHNITYNLWTLGCHKLLIRNSIHGNVRAKRSIHFVSLVPKLEYQSHYGVEQVTLSETCRSWVSLLIRNHCKQLRARINALTSEVVMLEELGMEEVLHPRCPINPQASLTMLDRVVAKLVSLSPGCYLLSHVPGNAHAHIKKAVDTKIGVYNFHLAHQNIDNADASRFQWVPIDPSIHLPSHKKWNRIPATFEPKDSGFKGPQKMKGKRKKQKQKQTK